LLGTGIAGTVLVAVLAFWLSFTALTHLAVRAGIGRGQAWAWPLIVDGVIVVATVAVVALRDRRGHCYAWALLIMGALVSVTANAVQAAMPAGLALARPLAAAVCAVPPVVLLAVTHLTVVLARHEHQPQPDSPAPEPAPVSVAAPPVALMPPPRSEDTASALVTDPVSPSAAAAVPQPQTVAAGPPPSTKSAHGHTAGPGEPRPPQTATPAAAGDADTDLAESAGVGSRELMYGGVDRLRVARRPEPATAAEGVGEGSRTWRVEEAIRLRGEGLSNRAIGERLGVDGTTVGRWLRETRLRSATDE
jgi:hypothetical protein